MSGLPLVNAPIAAPIAWHRGRQISRGEYLAHVARAAARLPAGRHAVNLCTDRYHFMVAFGALLLRGQTNLLPPSHAPQVIDEIANDYGAYCLIDQPLQELAAPLAMLDFSGAAPGPHAAPEIPSELTAVVLFTSGSTGKPAPTPKTWAQLVGGTATALRRFGFDHTPAQLVATVPPQHSYGLESTVLYALLSACTVHSGRPFYAEDVRAALSEVNAPRVLITTPVHLRTCTEAGLDWPETAFIISATAPLSVELARNAEHTFGCPVHEIYGCSEAGALASRRTLDGPRWRPYEGIRVETGDPPRVSAAYLPSAQPLADALRVYPDGEFELLGRSADMLNIAGKRGSLQDLNQRLLAIDGVVDGIFLVPQEATGGRLAALVVAPNLEEGSILDALRRSLDPVFLPRPLLKVDALPRNETGKLTRQAAEEMLALHRSPTPSESPRLPYMRTADAPLLWHRGRMVTRGEFLHLAHELAHTLPDGNHALNLSSDRYGFMLGLAALLLRGQTIMLPPSQAPQVIAEIAAEYDAYCLTDQPLDTDCATHYLSQANLTAAGSADGPASVSPTATVTLFTSGSTGKPQPSRKTWPQLVAGIRLGMRRFGLDAERHQLVATVPPQHMFGLEFSILYPLLGPSIVHSARPFYPADIHAALVALDAPRVLLTTPLHLRACAESGLDWPPLAFVISSTAALEPELAARAEAVLDCPVYEIYGSSETGAVASRRTAEETRWTPLDGIRAELTADGLLCISGPQLAAPQLMGDYAALHDDGRFELRGRKSELINIAGKRIALGDLNRRLLAIDGVVDGVFLAPEDGSRASRLTAVVVAPGLSEGQILQALGRALDPVFLPRPLIMVDALPRNETGKLPRAALLDLVERRKRR